MLTAVASDLAALPGNAVVAALHPGQPPLDAPGVSIETTGDLRVTVERLAGVADATIVIAPELRETLTGVCGWVMWGGGRLALQSISFIEAAADKVRAANLLGDLALPTLGLVSPIAASLHLEGAAAYGDLMVKPRSGAGGVGTARVKGVRLDLLLEKLRSEGVADELMVQAYHEGFAASVTVV
ncbi:MAG: hypothetical protein ACRDD1_18890, partial [Planctomycetia bacterium]